MDIHVDYARCEGHGLCEEVASSLFRLDDEGELGHPLRRGTSARGYEDDAMRAVRACPVSALRAQSPRPPAPDGLSSSGRRWRDCA